jgi:hypothetical protein
MNDPVYVIIRTVLDTSLPFVGVFGHLSPIVNVLIVAMALLLLKSNLGGSKERSLERHWSNICGTLIGRIEKLSQVYTETNFMYARAQKRGLTGNKGVVQCVRSIPKDIKSKAEQDYCLHDVDRPENLAMLQEQLKRLLEDKI